MTFHLLRSAHFLKADSTGWAGYEFPDELEAVAASGLYADKSQTDRLVVDLSLCFRRFDQIPVWHGILSWIYLVTPYTAATFNGLQFFVARPLGDEIDAEISADPSRPSPTSPTSRTFEIISVQLGIVQTRRETGRAKPPNGTHDFEGRNRFDTQAAYRAYQLIQYSAAVLDRAEFVFCMFSAWYGTILFFSPPWYLHYFSMPCSCYSISRATTSLKQPYSYIARYLQQPQPWLSPLTERYSMYFCRSLKWLFVLEIAWLGAVCIAAILPFMSWMPLRLVVLRCISAHLFEDKSCMECRHTCISLHRYVAVWGVSILQVHTDAGRIKCLFTISAKRSPRKTHYVRCRWTLLGVFFQTHEALSVWLYKLIIWNI